MSWKQTILGEIVNLKRGFDLPASKRIEGPYPIYSSSGQTGTHSEAAANGPCVITGRYGTIGQVFFSDKSCWPLNTSLYSTDFKGNDPRFVYYLLKTIPWQEYTTASAVPGINRNHVHRCPVCVPDYRTQTAIVSVLGALDEQMAINVKLNGYLADAVDGLFEKALGQAEEKTLTDVVEILSGGTPKTKISEYWEDGEIPFFGPGDANGSAYCLTTAKRITQLGLENCNSELYPVDTVFLTARGTVGKVAMAGKPMAMNQSCFAFRGLGVSQPAVYQIIKRAVRSLKAKAKAKAKANGATFAAINTRDLKIETILVPSDEELTAFEEEAASLHSMMRVNEEESLKLSSLRDALLPKLIAGEIDVSKIDLTQLNSHLVDC